MVDLEVFKDFFQWTPPSWVSQSLCRRIPNPTTVFFPSRVGKRKNADIYAVARNVCSVCPVRWDCLLDRLDEEYGAVGGTSPTQRETIRSITRIRTKTYIKDLTERIEDGTFNQTDTSNLSTAA